MGPSVEQSLAEVGKRLAQTPPSKDSLLKLLKNVSPAAHKLSVSVVQRCAEKLEPFVQRFLTSVMLEGKAAGSDLQEDYHDIIFGTSIVHEIEIDKAHLRLAAAKSVLRLARRWDFHILPQVFHLTVLKAQDSSVHVRQQFLAKTHEYLKERAISNKYACAFALAASDAVKDVQADAKQYLSDFVDNYRREARLRQTSTLIQLEGAALTGYPEYVLAYLVHVLGHHPSFPMGTDAEDAEAYRPFYSVILQTDGSHLPHCLIEGKGLASFLHGGYVSQSTQPYSPRGKQAKRNQDEGSISEENEHDTEEESLQKQSMMSDTLTNSIENLERGKSWLNHKKKSHAQKQGQNSKCRPHHNESVKSEPARVKSRKKEEAVGSVSTNGRKRGRKNKPVSANERIQHLHKTDQLMSENAKKQRPEMDMQSQDCAEQLSASDPVVGEENHHCDSDQVDTTDGVSAGAHQDELQIEVECGLDNVISKAPVKSRSCQKTLLDIYSQSQSSRNEEISGECIEGVGQEHHNVDVVRKMLNRAVQGCKTPAKDSVSKSPAWKADKEREADETLVGKRINVWWPIDRRFYSGTIEDFDSGNKTHTIAYDNGEVELLHLVNERWELISSSCSYEMGALEFPAKKREMRITPSVDLDISNTDMGSSLVKENGVRNLTSLCARKEIRCEKTVHFDGRKTVEALPETGITPVGEEQNPLKNSDTQDSDFDRSKRGKKKQGKQSTVDKRIMDSKLQADVSDDEPLITSRTRRRKVH